MITQAEYNCLNLPRFVTDANDNVLTYTYNELGKVKIVTDSDNRSQEYGYNSRGMNTSVRDKANGTSSATYDVLGNLTRLAGPLGAATLYSYDDMGRLISETTSSGGVVQYGYNELNVKKQLINARGQIRKYFYDAKGRITGFVGEEDSVSYVYDANGNVVTVSDKNGTVKREYDALNRVTKYTDTYGKSICYEYDAAGNLSRLNYPDNTSVTYLYDANNNLTSVTDWAGRVTSYTYDVNNKVTGVTKPDGSTVTTVYDHKQRVTSTVEKTASGTVITGFEYIYDSFGRISTEKDLAKGIRMSYTYDELNRVVTRGIVSDECDELLSEEHYTYDAAGNITDAPGSCFNYDTNNRLTAFQNDRVGYDLDGNMLHYHIGGELKELEYDSANRLISAMGQEYTYNAEDTRIRNICGDEDTTYTYNTNCSLSQLLVKTTNGIVTKYVYGLGLIGEEKCEEFKTYHFDYRGSTIAVTDASGNITDTFKYDNYGKLTERTGESDIIFCYNGRDGVVTEKNGLIYMRARYYSPDLRRFVNADIIRGAISDSTSLNRYAYVNGNPASLVDPFGLSAERSDYFSAIGDLAGHLKDGSEIVEEIRGLAYNHFSQRILLERKPKRIPEGSWIIKTNKKLTGLDDLIGDSSKFAKGVSSAGQVLDVLGNVADGIAVGLDTGAGIVENIENGTRAQKIVSDAVVDIGVGVGISAASTAIGGAIGTAIPVPIVGTIVGAGVGYLVGEGIEFFVECDIVGDKSLLDLVKDGAGWLADRYVDSLKAKVELIGDVGSWILEASSMLDIVCS